MIHKHISSWRRWALLALTALTGLMQAAENSGPAPRLPIELFFDDQSIRQAVISPDGSMVAMIAPNNGRYSIAVLDTKTGKVTVPVHFKDENIRSVFWKGSGRLLFTSAIAGHEVPLLASVDLQGKSYRRILEPRRTKDDFSMFFGTLVDRYPYSDEHILIVGYTSESDASKINPSAARNLTPTVYKTNVKTGRRAQIVGMDRGVEAGWFDAAGNQRLTARLEGMKVEFCIRAKNDHPWKVVKTFDATNIGWEVQTLMADGRTAYLIDYEANDRGALRSLNLDTGELSAPLYVAPEGEVVDLIFSPKRDRVLGVIYEGALVNTQWIDPRWAGIHQAVASQYPGQTVVIGSMSDDEKRFLCRVFSDRDPGQYILGDMQGAGLRLQPVSAVRPAIKPELMAKMTPISYQARDGLEIQGYFTMPVGMEGKKPNLLILPHGGPFGPRDRWGFNNEVQFFANRGYAVLQVNYRGSGGYGRKFEQAGYQEWGAKMQDDLTDAVKWAVAQGYADPDRVGIMGASYGGYAALAGVTMTPELYKVGINYVGVSDLRLITRYDLRTDAASVAAYTKQVGRDPALLAARSPVEHVQNIRVPTLHAYGRNDPRVDFGHWEVLEKALKKHGKTYEILIEDKEGHGFEKQETAFKYYGAVEAFLAKYLPADRGGTVNLDALKVLEMPARPK